MIGLIVGCYLYSKNNRSVVSGVIIANIFLLDGGRTTETCSSLSGIN
jgi:hypothetical protein